MNQNQLPGSNLDRTQTISSSMDENNNKPRDDGKKRCNALKKHSDERCKGAVQTTGGSDYRARHSQWETQSGMVDGYRSFTPSSSSTAELNNTGSGKTGSLETLDSENLGGDSLELDESKIHVEADLSSLFDDFESEVQSTSAPGRVATADEIAAADCTDWKNVPSHFLKTSEILFLMR